MSWTGLGGTVAGRRGDFRPALGDLADDGSMEDLPRLILVLGAVWAGRRRSQQTKDWRLALWSATGGVSRPHRVATFPGDALQPTGRRKSRAETPVRALVSEARHLLPKGEDGTRLGVAVVIVLIGIWDPARSTRTR